MHTLKIDGSYFKSQCSISFDVIGEETKKNPHYLIAAIPFKKKVYSFEQPNQWHLFNAVALRKHFQVEYTNPNTRQVCDKVVYVWNRGNATFEVLGIDKPRYEQATRDELQRWISTVEAASKPEVSAKTLLAQIELSLVNFPEAGHWCPALADGFTKLLETDQLPNSMYMDAVQKIEVIHLVNANNTASNSTASMHLLPICKFDFAQMDPRHAFSAICVQLESVKEGQQADRLSLRLLVDLSQKLGEQAHAKEILMSLLERCGNDYFVSLMLGLLVVNEPEAEEHLQRAITLQPTSAFAHGVLAYHYALHADEGPKADIRVLEHAQTALKIDPNSLTANFALGTYFFDSASENSAFALLAKEYCERVVAVVAVDALNQAACSQLGYLHHLQFPGLQQNYVRALQYYERSLQVAESDYIYSEAGQICFDGGYGLVKDYDKAYRYLSKAYEMGVVSVDLCERLSQIYAQGLGGQPVDIAKAISILEVGINQLQGDLSVLRLHTRLAELAYIL